jgi:hypothetical protein
MLDVVLQDPSFDVSLNGPYHLSLKHDGDGLCAALLHLPDRTYRYVHLFRSENHGQKGISELLASDSIFQNSFKSTSGIFTDRHYLLLPNEFANNQQTIDELMRFHFSNVQSAAEKVQLNIDNIHVAYLSNISVAAELKKQYEGIRCYPHIYPFLWGILSGKKAQQESCAVFVGINHSFIDVAVVKGGKLQFCNSFNFAAPDDVVYFVLNVYEQLNFKTSDIPLFLSGNVAVGGTLFSKLSSFITKAQADVLSDKYKFPFSDKEPQYFQNLLNLYPCELSVASTVEG